MPGTSATAPRRAGVLNADSHVSERGHLHGPVDGHRCSGNSGHEHRDRDGRQRQRVITLSVTAGSPLTVNAGSPLTSSQATESGGIATQGDSIAISGDLVDIAIGTLDFNGSDSQADLPADSTWSTPGRSGRLLKELTVQDRRQIVNERPCSLVTCRRRFLRCVSFSRPAPATRWTGRGFFSACSAVFWCGSRSAETAS